MQTVTISEEDFSLAMYLLERAKEAELDKSETIIAYINKRGELILKAGTECGRCATCEYFVRR